MTTPTGLLRYGQRGRYSGWDDRVVITALGGRRTGIVVPVRLASAAGLAITLEAHWLAVAPCEDGTTAVITSPVAVSVPVWPADEDAEDERRDVLLAEIADVEAATWSLSVVPEYAGDSGLVLGWVVVPPYATSAADMRLEPRPQDFSTGGAIPGPVGPPGPQGPPGSATLIVGSFTNRTPAELPPTGFIPAGWDGAGNPANDVQVEVGWSVIYTPDGSMWTFVTEAGPGGPWISPGVVQGPPGERGPQGVQGPQGEQGPPGDMGVGPWRTLTTPTTPAGLLAATRFRYRLLAALNSVQVDFQAHMQGGLNPNTTWNWPAMLNDCWVSRPGGQDRIYLIQGQIPVNTSGAERALARHHFAANGVSVLHYGGAVAGGVGTLDVIIPRD